MKKLLILSVVVGLAGLAQASFVETNPLPYWTGTDGSTAGNPYTDGNGNQWTVYAANGANGGEGNPHFGYWDAWTPLSFNSANNSWGNRPGFTSGKTFQADGYYNAPGLIVTVDAAGTYSWYGDLDAAEFNSPTVVFGKITGGTWSAIYTNNQTIPLYSNLDLGTVAGLQNISLNAGDSLTLYIGKLGGGWTDVTMSSTGIGFVPEPVTLGLLVVGVLMLRRRK